MSINVYQVNHPGNEEYYINRDNNISEDGSKDDENESPNQDSIPIINENTQKNNEKNIYNFHKNNQELNGEIYVQNTPFHQPIPNSPQLNPQNYYNKLPDNWRMKTYNPNKRQNYTNQKNAAKYNLANNYEPVDNINHSKDVSDFIQSGIREGHGPFSKMNKQTNYAPLNLKDQRQNTPQSFKIKNNLYQNPQNQFKTNNLISSKKTAYNGISKADTATREVSSSSSRSISPNMPNPLGNYHKYNNDNPIIFAADELQGDTQKINTQENNSPNYNKPRRDYNEGNYDKRLTNFQSAPKNKKVHSFPLEINPNKVQQRNPTQEKRQNIPDYRTSTLDYSVGQNTYIQPQINKNIKKTNYMNKDIMGSRVKKVGQNITGGNINNNQMINRSQPLNNMNIRGNVSGQFTQIHQTTPNFNKNFINNINQIIKPNLLSENKLNNNIYNNLQRTMTPNLILNRQYLQNINIINPYDITQTNNLQNISYQNLTIPNLNQNIFMPPNYSNYLPTQNIQQNENVDFTFSDFDDTGIVKNFCGVSRPGSDEFGQQKINQDTFIVLTKINGIKNFNLFGVLDGHGSEGHLISQFVSELLPTQISNDPGIINLKNTEDIYQALKKHNYEIIKNAYKYADEALQNSGIDATLSGTTCVIIFQIGVHVICSNAGDSRAILVYDENADSNLNSLRWAALSKDHKPELPEEIQRIINSGGDVEQFHDEFGTGLGPYRVFESWSEFPGLAMSRSIGDLRGKGIGVIPYPGIRECTITEKIKYIIVCSDGVWEFLENDIVAGIGKEFYLKNDPCGLCYELIERSLEQWKEMDVVVDDITAVVCFF